MDFSTGFEACQLKEKLAFSLPHSACDTAQLATRHFLFGTRDTRSAVFDTNGNLLVWLYIIWSSYNFLRLACSVIHAWGLEVCGAGVSPSFAPVQKKNY